VGGSGPTGGNPFEGLPFFGDLAKMLASSGPVHWDAARQFALAAATGGTAEPNPDPLERIRLEELARVAELRVADASGLPTAPGGRLVRITPVTRAEWATRTLDAYRPIFERLSTALSAAREEEAATDDVPAVPGDPEADLLGGMFAMLTPVLLGVQAGSMVGHLATRALGQYDLPLPRPRSDELLLVPANLNALAEEWSLPPDDLRLFTCVSELATHAVLGVPHVRNRLETLVLDYVGAFRPDPSGLEARFGEVELSDPEGLQKIFGDPAQLLGALRSPAQAALLPPLEALVAVVVGVVDGIVETVSSGLLSDAGRLTEALHRRRVEATPADRLVEQLLGLELGAATFERGEAFVQGVVERGGPAALAPLWRDERCLPTPAEVDAPGLWLARLEYEE
jgi:putative hydrolase